MNNHVRVSGSGSVKMSVRQSIKSRSGDAENKRLDPSSAPPLMASCAGIQEPQCGDCSIVFLVLSWQFMVLPLLLPIEATHCHSLSYFDQNATRPAPSISSRLWLLQLLRPNRCHTCTQTSHQVFLERFSRFSMASRQSRFGQVER